MKTTTYQQALANGEISLEIPVYESQHLFVSQKSIIKISDSKHLKGGGGSKMKTIICKISQMNISFFVIFLENLVAFFVPIRTTHLNVKLESSLTPTPTRTKKSYLLGVKKHS
ncbi:hypothetical protein [Helicobacter typhlonius]|uniref:hypothetical protein n=1 Tax=Helicobacter typhlonius TaxID=76936 RepID=UPI002FE24A49